MRLVSIFTFIAFALAATTNVVDASLKDLVNKVKDAVKTDVAKIVVKPTTKIIALDSNIVPNWNDVVPKHKRKSVKKITLKTVLNRWNKMEKKSRDAYAAMVSSPVDKTQAIAKVTKFYDGSEVCLKQQGKLSIKVNKKKFNKMMKAVRQCIDQTNTPPTFEVDVSANVPVEVDDDDDGSELDTGGSNDTNPTESDGTDVGGSSGNGSGSSDSSSSSGSGSVAATPTIVPTIAPTMTPNAVPTEAPTDALKVTRDESQSRDDTGSSESDEKLKVAESKSDSTEESKVVEAENSKVYKTDKAESSNSDAAENEWQSITDNDWKSNDENVKESTSDKTNDEESMTNIPKNVLQPITDNAGETNSNSAATEGSNSETAPGSNAAGAEGSNSDNAPESNSVLIGSSNSDNTSGSNSAAAEGSNEDNAQSSNSDSAQGSNSAGVERSNSDNHQNYKSAEGSNSEAAESSNPDNAGESSADSTGGSNVENANESNTDNVDLNSENASDKTEPDYDDMSTTSGDDEESNSETSILDKTNDNTKSDDEGSKFTNIDESNKYDIEESNINNSNANDDVMMHPMSVDNDYVVQSDDGSNTDTASMDQLTITPYVYNPALAEVAPFTALDLDGDAQVTSDEWTAYVTGLHDASTVRVEKGKDDRAKRMIKNVIEFHYSILGGCISNKVGTKSLKDDATFQAMVNTIESNCYVKFRYSLLAGPPPFEWVAKRAATVTAPEIEAWFNKAVTQAKDDVKNKSIVKLTPEEHQQLEHVMACIYKVLGSSTTPAFNRDLYYTKLDQVGNCVSSFTN